MKIVVNVFVSFSTPICMGFVTAPSSDDRSTAPNPYKLVSRLDDVTNSLMQIFVLSPSN